MKKIIINKQKFLIYFTITFLGFFLRYYLLEDRNSWHDEWHSIYVSDPNIKFTETVSRYLGNKGDVFLTEFYPILYLIILKYFFIFFGYTDDAGRVLSLIFGTLAIPLVIFISDKYFKNKNYFLSGLLVSLNLFLIWQSLEVRAHSIVVFFNLLCLILFIEILRSKNFLLNFIYFIVSVFTLSLWPITGALFFGKFLYLLQNYVVNKNKFNHVIILFLVIPLTYILLNIDYLKLNIARDFHYTTLYQSFFYNYHFRTFFGSIFCGGFFLFFFSLIVLKNIKKIFFKNNLENLFFYIIFSAYFLTLAYTILRGAAIMSPKYVIFLVPIIILVICNFIDSSKNNFALSFLVTGALIVNILFNYYNWPIKRPEVKKMFDTLANKSKERILLSKEDDVFNNYIKNTKKFKENNFTLYKLSFFPNDISSFWLVCQNYPSYAVGDSKRGQVDPKCKIDFNQYKVKESFMVEGLFLVRYEKFIK